MSNNVGHGNIRTSNDRNIKSSSDSSNKGDNGLNKVDNVNKFGGNVGNIRKINIGEKVLLYSDDEESKFSGVRGDI